MKRAGIAGFSWPTSMRAVARRRPADVFGTPQWYDAVRYAASEADRLGLEMTIFSSAG